MKTGTTDELQRGAELPRQMQVSPSSEPLRIAVVYSRLPFPMIRGDQRTVANLLSFLSARGHQVDLFTLDLHGELTQEQSQFINRACNQVHIYPQSKLRSLFGVIGALLRGLPGQVGFFQNANLNRDLRSSIDSGKYDIVYVYYMRSAPTVEDRFSASSTIQRNGRTVAAFLAMQLSQTLNWERMLERCTSLWRKPLYYIETNLVRRYESQVWTKFSKVLLIGPKDVEAVQQACQKAGQPPVSNWLYGAHGTDINAFRPAEPGEVIADRIVFSGNMGYRPNVEAAIWFVEKCWEKIRSVRSQATLYLVGWRPSDEVRALAERFEGVVVTGAVEDVGSYIRSAQVCINPVLAAAGMQNKLIEFLSSQRPVVATSAANEGILAPPEALKIEDTPEGFADSVIHLLQNRDEAEAMAERGRTFVQENWTWEAHFMKLEKDFRETLTAGSAG